MTTKRIPYDELTITKSDTLNCLVLATPWVEIDVEFEDEYADVVAQALDWARADRIAGSYSPAVDKVLSFVDGFPLFYTQPRAELEDEALLPLEFPGDLEGAEFLSKLGIQVGAASSIWDEELVVRLSRIHSKAAGESQEVRCDPLAAFLVIQRMRLRSELLALKDDGAKLLMLLEDLLKAGDPRFYQAMCRIIAQNYFISLKSQEAIHPALRRNKTNSVLSEYLESEQNHDRLLMDSMEKLGVDYSPAMVLPETESVIGVLSHAAKNNFFSFCCMIDSFEGEIYEEEDVFASLIKRSSRPEAAAGLNKHFEINVNEEHFDVGRQLCLTVGALPEREIRTAARLTKACTMLRSGMVSELLRVISEDGTV